MTLGKDSGSGSTVIRQQNCDPPAQAEMPKDQLSRPPDHSTFSLAGTPQRGGFGSRPTAKRGTAWFPGDGKLWLGHTVLDSGRWP